MDADEGRLNIDIGRAEFADEAAAAAEFGRRFPYFAEMAPHGYMRAQQRGDAGVRRVALLARSDRYWESLPTPFLRIRSAPSFALDPVADLAGRSDHAPLGLRLEAEPREKMAMDRGVDRQASAPGKIKELADTTVGDVDGDVWERLQSHAGALHLSAPDAGGCMRLALPLAFCAIACFHFGRAKISGALSSRTSSASRHARSSNAFGLCSPTSCSCCARRASGCTWEDGGPLLGPVAGGRDPRGASPLSRGLRAGEPPRCRA